MWLFWRYLKRPRRGVAVAYVLATAGAVYMQYLGAFVLPWQMLYALLHAAPHTARRRIRHTLLPIVAGLLFLPWLPAFLAQLTNPDYGLTHEHALPTE